MAQYFLSSSYLLSQKFPYLLLNLLTQVMSANISEEQYISYCFMWNISNIFSKSATIVGRDVAHRQTKAFFTFQSKGSTAQA